MIRNGGDPLQFRVDFDEIGQRFGAEGLLRTAALLATHPHQAGQRAEEDLPVIGADGPGPVKVCQTPRGRQLHFNGSVAGHQRRQLLCYRFTAQTGKKKKNLILIFFLI